MPAAPPPTETDLFALATAALAHAGRAAQVTAWWERSLDATADGASESSGVRVEVTAHAAGRAGSATVVDPPGDDALRQVAEAAVAAAAAPGARMAPGLPDPAPGRTHDGYDPALVRLDPEELRARGGTWRAGAAKVAILSTRGVRAYEQRSHAACFAGPLAVAAVSPASIDAGALAAEAAALDADPVVAVPPEGPLPVVLGPDTVAWVLDALRPDLVEGGALASRLGTRVAASCISLSDSPRFAATLPRSFDASGTPRRPVPLIQDSVAHRLVSPATGHALHPGGPAALPEHLVLVGGGAVDVDELMAPIDLGVYLPAPTVGFLVEGGRRAGRVDVSGLRVDALAILASAQALTSWQRTIPVGASGRTIGATVCPALRAGAGVTFEPISG